ncbi:Ribonuclease H-like domain containing protein [Parasponia andersonii]|uniref:Ribonuclease H-like domain containing protein n=1 Tax=Parasponia andersonii TaxID=3476 RepID=A0A2P5AF79_PARAD|nr:Ribonuclease H-like domain containing protein [Parasponia andersonii]
MHNSKRDLLLLHGFHLSGRPSCAPPISLVSRIPLLMGWLKVNTDGSSLGQPGYSTYGGIFQNFRGFVLGCFASKIGMAFPFKAELVGVITIISMAFVRGWHRL